MSEVKHHVAVIGCGWMGVQYVEAYHTYPDTEVVAIAEANPEQRGAVADRFGVKGRYADVHGLLRDMTPDVVAVVTPTKYFREVVMACAEAGVKGISVEKPVAGVLSDADEMVEVCESRGVVLAGGRVQRAMNEVQEAARRLRAGDYGLLTGASVHFWGNGTEISGGGNQHVNVLRLLADAEIEEVMAWGTPAEALAGDTDLGLTINGRFRLSNGIDCPVFGMATPYGGLDGGVDVWTETALVRADSDKVPDIFADFDESGARVPINPGFAPYEWSQWGYLTGSIRSFLATLETGSELWVSGHDLRQALEVAIAAKLSAKLGNVPVKLPLEDRSLSLYPRRGRWLGQAAGFS